MDLLLPCLNSFFIFNRENKDLQKIHYETVIKTTEYNLAKQRHLPLGASIRRDYVLDAQFVFKQYGIFRDEMREGLNMLSKHRKIVVCPQSQFNFGGHFSKSDYKSEIFHFIGKSPIPYTTNGRNFNERGEEGQIKELIDWKAEPLHLV